MQIIIEAEITNEVWQYPETPEVWIYALADFHSFNGVYILRGTPGTNEPHMVVPCSLTGGNQVLIESLEIPSTTDSPDNPYARYTAIYRLPSGKWFVKLGEFAIDPQPSGTTWENLTIQRKRGQYLRNPPVTYASIWDLNRMMDTKVGVLAKASESQFGGTYLTEDPVDPIFPIAVGDNDSRLLVATAAVLGRLRLSVPPVNPNDPIAVGDNDPRLITSEALNGVGTLVAGATTTILAPQTAVDSAINPIPMSDGITGNLRVSNRVAGVGFDVSSDNGADAGDFKWFMY